MKRWINLFPALIMVIAGSLISQKASAQCKVVLASAPHECNPATSTFLRTNSSAKSVSNYLWDFGDGLTSNDTTAIVSHLYKKSGCFTVTVTITYTDLTVCKATLAQKLCIYDPPIAIMNLPVDPTYGSTQCYRQSSGLLNKFCFTESSTPGKNSNATIVKYVWNFGDGSIDSAHQNPCHTYQAPGTYTISLRVVDTNRCSGVQFKTSSIVVLKDIKTKFSMTGKTSCNSATFSFKNLTDTSGLNMRSFSWDFGDGSPLDSVNYDVPSHLFYPGVYWVKLKITNNLGCSAVDSQKVTVDKFAIKAFFKDTICWSDAANNGVTFIAAQQANVVFWQWNFGDPNSMNLNVANYAWTASHKFVGGPGGALGGPGNYCVHFLMINSNPNCGKNGLLDTFFTVHIKGPMVMINLPPPPTFPLNNYYPALKMPRSVFTAILNSGKSCPPTTVKYSVFSKAAAATPHVTYKYCNADTAVDVNGKKLVKVDTATDCYGKDKAAHVTSVTLKPTDSTVVYYKDSTETTKLWTKGQDAPPTTNAQGYAVFGNQIAYYPSSGAIVWNNIHDSNMVTCTLPNLVRFVNNSIKYRLRLQMDDNTFTNVGDPGHSLRDTCRWKNYPMASDSLLYWWKFNDPTGKPCTSTVSNKDWNCNFSTLAAPYHLYKGPKVPNTRCQSVNLQVTDTKMNCADSTVFILKQGPPLAWWDTASYCKMTWDMQVTQLAPKGQAGPSGPPLIGLMLNNQPNACTGPVYPFRIDLSQTLPTCGATNWWAVWDSANVVKYKKCANPADSMLDYGFLGANGKNGYPAGGPAATWNGLPWLGNYWYEKGDSGCKTVGLVLQNGNCFDTAWYHDYICFNKLVPEFNIFNVIPPSGASRTEYFVDASTNFHGHICQRGFSEGVNVRLYPKDTNQKDVTSFKYSIQRRQFFSNPSFTNPNDAWYYNLPFWPDSATLYPFTTWNDSIKQIEYKVFYIDTPHLYIILNQPGLPPHRVVMNFPLYKNEIDSLNARKHVNVSLQDGRARRLSAVCGLPYVTLFVDKVVLKSSTQVINLKGFGAVDSLTIPYPGFYTIQSVATNLQGCLEPAQYHLIYGHFAEFDAYNDSIVCLGQSVKFHYYVRYWSTSCPPPPGGGPPPDGCLNGYDEGMPIGADFNPWNYTNPTALRDSLVPTWSTTVKPANYQPEQLWWNFGDNPFFNKVPNGSKISHTYTKPGVYTVSMRTIDWRGCAVTTVRRNLIKVIQPVASFKLANPGDTLNYCAPKTIMLIDNTKLLGASYVDKVVKKGLLVDSTYVVDSILTHTWTPGDGRTITRTTSDSVIFDYKDNGVYSVGLTVKTNHGCGDSKTIKNYITIIGPTPKFEPIGKLSGCSPFTLHIRNHNTKNVKSNTWHYGDDSLRFPNKIFPGSIPLSDSLESLSTQSQYTQPAADSIVNLTFTATHGHYRIYVTQTDTFHDLYGNKLPDCIVDWPTLKDSFQLWVTIFPNSSIQILGDTQFCVNEPKTWTLKTGYGEYKKFNWNFGNGSSDPNSKDSVETRSYTRTDFNAAQKDANGRAIFKISVHAISDSGCSRDTFITVHVEDSHADFAIDSSVKMTTGAAKFNFENKSEHAVKYAWDFGDGSPIYYSTDSTEIVRHEYTKNKKMWDTLSENRLDSSVYPVKLVTISPLGCKDSITKYVVLLREFNHYNVFTPGNGDNVNDKFVPGIVGSTEYNIKIFNRWGQKVFETNNKDENWDGTANGQPCPEGAYYYVWHFKLVGGIDKTIHGAVTLIRNK